MNGKHPIDDFFARGLRDAEAQPPPAVWEGIVRERDQRGAGKRRSRWGLAAVLLLLLGASGYWKLTDQSDASSGRKEPTEVAPSSTGEVGLDEHAAVETSAPAEKWPLNTDKEDLNQDGRYSDPQDQNEASPATAATGSGDRDADAEQQTIDTTVPTTEHAAKTPVTTDLDAGVTPRKTSKARRNADSRSAMKTIGTIGDGSSNKVDEHHSVKAGASAEKDGPGTAQAGASEERTRVSPDVHLAPINGVITRLMNDPATPPGPILMGDSTPAYVLKKGNWWLGVQGETSMLNASWKGIGSAVSELNASETWRGGQGFSLVVGRAWLSGWAVGLGVGMTKQRSRFLRREVEAAQTGTVVDTTWVGTAMGTQTNYTWDIVETVVTEPGIERDYSATNSYTRLRIAPEVGRDLLRKKRLTLTARLAPMMMLDIGRKGNTIVPSSTMDSLETVTTTTGTLELNDASLDERFPSTFAISAGLELRYRFCERWSVGLLPTFTYWMPRAAGPVPSLSMNELSGAVRLRYDLPHKELRVK